MITDKHCVHTPLISLRYNTYLYKSLVLLLFTQLHMIVIQITPDDITHMHTVTSD